jgi:hypothetical protein
LPATLQNLEITYPKATVYDCLAQLPYWRDNLPILNKIALNCASDFGNFYEIFAFDSYDHPVWTALRHIGVVMVLQYREKDSEEAWDKYDLKALDLVA